MRRNCFICSMKPIFYFSSFSSAFVSLECQHSKNATRSSIHKSNIRRTIGFALCLLLANISFYELYVDCIYTKFSLFSILTVTELICMIVGLCRNFLNNVFCSEKLKELQMMLAISEYTSKFNIEDNDFEIKRVSSLFGIASSIVSNSLPVTYFIYSNINVSTLLMALNRYVLGALLTARYLQFLYEFSYYRTFFKRTFTQIERELKERLTKVNNLKVIYRNTLLFPGYSDEGFLRRLKKLRKFYMVILSSFRRTKTMTNSSMVTVVLSYYLLLSVMLCIVVMGIRGDIELHIGHYLYVSKHCGFVAHLVWFAVLCGSIEELAQEMLTVLFKVPVNVLNEDEAREVELLIDIIAKEKPIDNSNDGMDYGKHILTLLVVDVVTNCMVIIQLYFWFQKVADEE